ncbi:MAG TPA: shikimate dehydrogenase [Actinomycetota bacterium]|nr:shikimate dehydrogenase [Actinomycetota bacterium]
MRRAAVLGSPISHSLSPALHRAAYRALGLDWFYEALQVEIGQLPGFVDALDETWVGLSLTMPLKEAVLDLAREVDPLARVTDSANTLLLPQRHALNTDVDGLVTALRRAGLVAPAGFTGTVIGAGATARSAIAAMRELGAAQVQLLARRPEAADPTRRTADLLGVPLLVRPLTEVGPLSAPLVISTIPAGAADHLAGAVPARPGLLLDVVYAPWPTPLARAWQAGGGRIVSGLEMLLGQAERQVELMTGRPAPTDAMRAALPGA